MCDKTLLPWLAAACFHQPSDSGRPEKGRNGKPTAGSWKEPELMEERREWVIEERVWEGDAEYGGWAGVKEVLTLKELGRAGIYISFEWDDEQQGDRATALPGPRGGATLNINTLPFQTHQFKRTRSSCACFSLRSFSLRYNCFAYAQAHGWYMESVCVLKHARSNTPLWMCMYVCVLKLKGGFN